MLFLSKRPEFVDIESSPSSAAIYKKAATCTTCSCVKKQESKERKIFLCKLGLGTE